MKQDHPTRGDIPLETLIVIDPLIANLIREDDHTLQASLENGVWVVKPPEE